MPASASTNREWATLLRLPGGGALTRAVRAAGSPSALWEAGPGQWRLWGLPADTCAALAHPPVALVEADLAWLERSGAQLLGCTDALWPAALNHLDDCPPALYVSGDAAALGAPQLAVVGSRAPTAAGRRLAAQLAGDLTRAGFVVTSGLAAGVDAAAHEAALAAGGRTVAVLGTGPDQCYPARNEALARRICGAGAVISEFPPGTGPRAWHFPRRNRLIAALARGTAVVEAAARSGSLITARQALELGRSVFAVPGSPLNPLAAGCLALLREGAVLTRHAGDILEELGLPPQKELFDQWLEFRQPGVSPGQRLDKAYEMLLDALGFEPASIDDLADRTGLAAGVVASMMLILELQGRVETRPGALFNRID